MGTCLRFLRYSQALTYDIFVSKNVCLQEDSHKGREETNWKNCAMTFELLSSLIFRPIAPLIKKNKIAWNDELLSTAVKRYPAMFEKSE